VPLDGSKFSECSLDHVKAIATGCGVPEVVLLMVLPQPLVPVPEVSLEQMAEEIGEALKLAEKKAQKNAEVYLTKIANSLKKKGIAIHTVPVWQKMAKGIAEDILHYASHNKIDLIIMSTHGRSGISRWALGSVTDKVIRHACVPVLTVAPPGCRK
jgi:nucleotide-binding universal stress UspA family protein